MISNETISQDLIGNLGSKVFDLEEHYGILCLSTQAENLIEVAAYLKNHSTFKFGFLTDICGIHFQDHTDKELCSAAMLHSWENNVRIRIKVYMPETKPEVPTLTTLWASANWMERETFDFYGIIYTGHPNLKRILNIDEMDYFPLRKQYAVEDATREDKIDALFGR